MPQGNRLTHMKLTGGCLKVKDLLAGGEDGSGVRWEEKVDQIRIYSGAGYETVSKVKAGSVCAVTGLGRTYSGQGLGIESASEAPLLEPVLTYQILLPEGCDVHGMFLKLRQLEEEEPELHIVWEKSTDEDTGPSDGRDTDRDFKEHDTGTFWHRSVLRRGQYCV